MECLQTISIVHRALGDNGALPPDVLHDLEHLLPHGGAGGENLDVVRRQLYSALKTVIKIGYNIMSCHLESSDIFSRCHVVLIVGPLAGGERQEVGGHLDNVKELPGVFRHEVIEVICRVAADEFKRNMPRWLAVHSVHWDSKMMSDLSNELREILAILVSDASDYVEGELIGMFA